MKVLKSMLFVLLIGSLCVVDHTAFARNRSNRSSKRVPAAAAALVGAGAGGGLAGALGGAKWAPLGIFGGAATGYFLIRALRNNGEAKVNHAKKMSDRRYTSEKSPRYVHYKQTN